MGIEEFAEKIKTKEEFEQFLKLLVEDYRQNNQLWENDNLELFLAGTQNFLRDISGYYSNNKVKVDCKIQIGKFLQMFFLLLEFMSK